MKKRVIKKVASPRQSFRLGDTEFLLLVFVAVILLAYFGISTGLLPKFLSDSVLGVTSY